jgi:arabinofuranan 3-O-arabinosyltransferase
MTISRTAPEVPGRSWVRRNARSDHPETAAGEPAGTAGPAARDADADAASTRASRRWFLLVWAVALVIFMATDRGRMTFDTKLGVDIDAARFFARLWPLWNPLEWFGTLQNQYVGYAIPMAPFFLAGQLLHAPVWIIERLWLSLLVAVGFLGLARLAAALRIGTDASRIVAGVVFALWPTFTIVIGSTSATALPGLLAPWAVLPLVTAARRRRPALQTAARSGTAVLLMGGVNATVTICALILPAFYLVTHFRGRERRSLCLWWVLAVAAATSWWAIPLLLQGRYAYNFLPYVEQSATTTQYMSAAAFLRGAGNWTAYFNLGTPWLSAGWAVVTSPLAIAASAVASAVGLYGLARSDMPGRTWLRVSAGVAAVAALAGYWGPLGGPLHSTVDELLNGSLAPFRSVYKLEPVVAAALTLGIAHAVGRWSQQALRTGYRSRPVAARILIAPVIAAVLAGLALPYLTGQILQPGSFSQVPSYWSAVAAFLAARSPTETALVVPADTHGTYLWGDPIDDPLEPLASSPWAERGLVPYGGAGSQVFLETAESAIESGQQVPGLAAYLDRAGIRYVVVRNDLSPYMIGYTPPELVHQTLALSGFRRVAAFGPEITGAQTSPGAPQEVQTYLPKYPAVEVFQADDPADSAASPVAALPVSKTVLVNGGPDSLLQLEGQGVIGNQPTVIAGDPVDGRPALWAITDGQRRADNAFGLVNSNVSYTYTASQTNPVDDPLGDAGGQPRQILPVPAAGHQTVAVLSGAAQVTASSAGSWLYEQPQYDPANAFDGNPATSWVEASPTTPVGQWIQITFDRTMDLPASIGIQLLDDGLSRPIANQLQVSTAAGKVASVVTPTSATQRIAVRPGPSRWLRITIAGASNVISGFPGAGIRDVLIPGVKVTTYLRPPEDPAGRAAPAVAYSFRQAPPSLSATAAGTAESLPLARTFSVPAAETLRVTAAAVPVQGPALTALLDRVDPPARSQIRVTASSTWDSLPELGPSSLLSGSATAPWIAGSPDGVIQLSWRGDRRIAVLVVQPAYGFPTSPSQVQISSPAGTREANVELGGVVPVVPPLTTNQMSISLAEPGGSGQQLPLALSRLSVPALRGMHVAAPDPSARFSLGCGQGPSVTVDGRRYRTAVSGTVSELAGGLPVSLRLCTAGAALSLGAGSHRLLAAPSSLLTVTDLTLRGGTGAATASSDGTAAARAVRVLAWQPDSRAVRMGPGAASYLEVHQNANPGWVATLDGRRLESATLDGWQQAFVVPAGAGGVVTMTFAPATWYHIGLILSGLAVICLLIVAAGWRRWMPYLARYRRGPAAQPTAASTARFRHRAPRRPAAIRPWIGVLAVCVLIALVGGPVALAVPVLAVIGVRWPRLLPGIAAAAMLGAGAVAATTAHPTAMGSGAFAATAQVCALVALAAALVPAVKIPAATSIFGVRLAGPGKPADDGLQALKPASLPRAERMLR